MISFGLWQGGSAAGYLFPLYFWLILGNGIRFGAKAMGAAVASSTLGFAAVCLFSPVWREDAALSIGLGLSIVIIPIYGALLLRRAALARAEAERANHAKTLLLASVSHELRTPLTAIVGLGALLQKTPLDDEQREMVQTMEGAGGLLMRHIEALLNVSRDEMERRQKPQERIDLLALLASLRGLLAVEADKKGVRLGLSIEAETPRHVRSEPGLLLDLLQNLGGNAVKFTAAGAVAIHVKCLSRGADSLDLRVEVHDTGIGVEKAAQDRIFDSFVQANPEISRRFGGSGLGLAIARRRLEACGGRIGVISDIGKGAVFWFELTVGAEDHLTRPAAATRERKAAALVGFRRPDRSATDCPAPLPDSAGARKRLGAGAAFRLRGAGARRRSRQFFPRKSHGRRVEGSGRHWLGGGASQACFRPQNPAGGG